MHCDIRALKPCEVGCFFGFICFQPRPCCLLSKGLQETNWKIRTKYFPEFEPKSLGVCTADRQLAVFWCQICYYGLDQLSGCSSNPSPCNALSQLWNHGLSGGKTRKFSITPPSNQFMPWSMRFDYVCHCSLHSPLVGIKSAVTWFPPTHCVCFSDPFVAVNSTGCLHYGLHKTLLPLAY